MTGETEKRILRPFSIEDIPWEPRGEHFGGCFKTLANSDRDNIHLGVHIEELPPGKQSSPFHYHLHEEEHFLIFEGEVTLRFGEERILLKKGDFVTSPAGQKLGHCFINREPNLFNISLLAKPRTTTSPSIPIPTRSQCWPPERSTTNPRRASTGTSSIPASN